MLLSRIAAAIEATSRLVSRLVANLCVALVYVMLGLLAAQVLMRYFLGAPPSWTEELAIILFAWLVLLYASVGLREGFHVAIQFIPADWIRLNRLADRLVALLAMGFGAVAVSAGLAYVGRTSGQKTAALQMPIETLYLAVPVCGGLFILHALALLIAPGHRAAASEASAAP
ncbi:MAG: TRAP transporter small permease [Alphaproteobacteria bacterium HGW-Alphaproteobacteria-1]|jgi:TRAP-type C4-dicarboxylate transport system permease small subunit|nr:MAG: TRAP transporter small permease [Alphaproteobacteria bacterium HGW-Alphaproteobacteria-1]